MTDYFERMKEELGESGVEFFIGESVLTSSKALCDIAECDAAIIVEFIGKSKYKNIYNELSVCMNHNVTVLGSILVV